VSLQGQSRHSRRLRALEKNAERIGKLAYIGADMIKTEARRSITAGSVSGKGHVPSRPGEPPNRDTGNLDTNIEAFKTGPFTAETRSQSRHAFIEWDTRNMAARPYMRPAVKVVMPRFKDKLRTEVKRMVRES
jgi:hypothetical protein